MSLDSGLRRHERLGIGLFAGLMASVAAVGVLAQSGGTRVPAFEVDPAWPKALPNNWIVGPGSGPGQFATSLHDVIVDSHGNLYTGEAAAAGRVQKFKLK